MAKDKPKKKQKRPAGDIDFNNITIEGLNKNKQSSYYFWQFCFLAFSVAGIYLTIRYYKNFWGVKFHIGKIFIVLVLAVFALSAVLLFLEYQRYAGRLKEKSKWNLSELKDITHRSNDLTKATFTRVLNCFELAPESYKGYRAKAAKPAGAKKTKKKKHN